MAEVITMPRLSDTMEEGTVAKWLKQVGDKVEEGDILAEIETDKATMEFESFHQGTLLHIGIQEGEGAPVDSLLAIIGDEGEDFSALLNGASATPAKEEVAETKPAEAAAPASAPVSIPEGVEVVSMPRLSDTMEEGTVASWLKKVGDTVEEGDILAEIETDKATMEFESFYSGTLLYIGIQEGEGAPVDSLLAIIGPAGTDVDAVLSAQSGGGATSAPAAEPTKTEAPAAETSTAAPVASASSDGQRILASPLAKKIASEKGINLADVKGTGDHGRIVKKDVESYQPSQTAAPAPEKAVESAPVAPIALPVGEESIEEVKNSTMRKVIAKRLGESKFSAPHYYLTIEVDMENAKASRSQINNLPDTKVSFNDMVLKACAMALKKHPQVNTSWNGDTTVYKHHVHMGVAVAVDEGLVVPVIKFADQMTLSQLGASVKDLAGRARNKKIKPDEMEGSTFTVSNLGMFGILEFTSIINQPNSAILSVGAIVEKPVVKNGEIVVGSTMKITLACDHRTVDGATGAQFLQTLRAYLENPVTMLA
ncbi:pyruvate dehydrogenase complex dihydrolipoamide acetyltransferase [Flagellimonas zhangzhouensis]|uniref:Dihydrolipoamide acetyltransferase component of pyruvate dehydrogenase complex n=1 Tax=Flagellimonas zhangzhouensis TaxID=1073328 RepID=A0A1H2Q2J9_9FLAO|nr:pyruvate dehydrogenase complex dihydrolipoamide acetyltransferase [Allomuricauda zhangzhouensis]SDQ47253.1 pyruvate dehydrogenase E2 component (dihydrolipoamide acetyltransferase) [Allomuricauda zhangzhouensis]SDW01365.1 pyruvate dehydrogenase E2 component (dihydrolipoamide acetyltransferase) [Allomuricauda zhangzhouensis]